MGKEQWQSWRVERCQNHYDDQIERRNWHPPRLSIAGAYISPLFYGGKVNACMALAEHEKTKQDERSGANACVMLEQEKTETQCSALSAGAWMVYIPMQASGCVCESKLGAE